MKPMPYNLEKAPKYSSVGEPDKGVKEIIDEYNEYLDGLRKELIARAVEIVDSCDDKFHESEGKLIEKILGDTT